MRIDPGTLARLRAAQLDVAPAPEPTANARPTCDTTGGNCSHTPSAELIYLLGQLREQLEVRREVVERVLQRMAEGYYLTSEAAERTADALLAAKVN